MEQIALMEVLVYGLKDELGRSYKESEMIRQRLNSFENEFKSARTCVGHLVKTLTINEGHQLVLEEEVERAERKATEFEMRLRQLEQDNIILKRERDIQSKKNVEVIAKSALDESSWKRALELASTHASERAEHALADCEWKMRELEKRARDSDKKVAELSISVEKCKQENDGQAAELSQVRALNDEQLRSVTALSSRCVAAESREMTLKQELQNARERTAALEENVKELESAKAELSHSQADCEMLQQRHVTEVDAKEKHEQEMGKALEREKKVESLRCQDKDRVEPKNTEQATEHLSKRYACLNKLLQDLKTRDVVATETQLAQQKEIQLLRSEVTRLSEVIVHNGITPNTLKTKSCADELRCDQRNSQQTSAEACPDISSRSKRSGQFNNNFPTNTDTKYFRKRRRCSPKLVLAPKICYARQFRKRKLSFSSGKSRIGNLPAVQVPILIEQLERKIINI